MELTHTLFFSLLELAGFLLPAVAYHVSGSLVVLYAILIVYYVAHAMKLPSCYKSYKINMETRIAIKSGHGGM
jgi:hypothetical protein